MTPPVARFTCDDADAAYRAWRFNCGPASVCLVRRLRPDDVRPHFAAAGFEQKGYTNPTLMFAVLKSMGIRYRRVPLTPGIPHVNGLVRVQWSGPWCTDGVPIQARYRHTHWVASWFDFHQHWIGDVNATCCDGWVDKLEWADQLVPWLLRECELKANGQWWPTHVLEIAP